MKLLVKKVTLLDRHEYLEYECPSCLSTFFYDTAQIVHIHHCSEAGGLPRPVYVLNEHVFLNVDHHNYQEKLTAVKENQ